MRAALVLLSLISFLPLSVSAARAENRIPFVDVHTHLFRGVSGWFEHDRSTRRPG